MTANGVGDVKFQGLGLDRNIGSSGDSANVTVQVVVALIGRYWGVHGWSDA